MNQAPKGRHRFLLKTCVAPSGLGLTLVMNPGLTPWAKLCRPFGAKHRQGNKPMRHLAHLIIVLYGRPGCHLCEEAEALLQARRSRYCFRLKKVNIDDEPGLV